MQSRITGTTMPALEFVLEPTATVILSGVSSSRNAGWTHGVEGPQESRNMNRRFNAFSRRTR